MLFYVWSERFWTKHSVNSQLALAEGRWEQKGREGQSQVVTEMYKEKGESMQWEEMQRWGGVWHPESW